MRSCSRLGRRTAVQPINTTIIRGDQAAQYDSNEFHGAHFGHPHRKPTGRHISPDGGCSPRRASILCARAMAVARIALIVPGYAVQTHEQRANKSVLAEASLRHRNTMVENGEYTPYQGQSSESRRSTRSRRSRRRFLFFPRHGPPLPVRSTGLVRCPCRHRRRAACQAECVRSPQAPLRGPAEVFTRRPRAQPIAGVGARAVAEGDLGSHLRGQPRRVPPIQQPRTARGIRETV